MTAVTRDDFNSFIDREEEFVPEYKNKLWEVNDLYAKRPDLKFASRDSAPFCEYTLENNGQSPLQYTHIPPDLIEWIENVFLRAFKIPYSSVVTIKNIASYVFRYLDEDPYFFLVDMPIHLTANHTEFTYQKKSDKSVFDPIKTEVFEANENWEYKHYKYVTDCLLSPIIQGILDREYQPKNTRIDHTPQEREIFYKKVEMITQWYASTHTAKESEETPFFKKVDEFLTVNPVEITGGYKIEFSHLEKRAILCSKIGFAEIEQSFGYVPDQDDVFRLLCLSVYGQYDRLLDHVTSFATSYYDNASYDAKTIEEKAALDDSMQTDGAWWIAVTLGVMTWIKSPRGVKFLTQYHPMYVELLEWDNVHKKAVIIPITGGEAIVTGWQILTLQDVDKLKSVHPGTCCVTNQAVHCTKRINATYVNHPICYCRRPFDYQEEEGYGSSHHKEECYRFAKDHPDRYTFISYGALANKLANRPLDTKCERIECPNTTCKLHAGYWMRVQALTNNRTKMLTSSPRT